MGNPMEEEELRSRMGMVGPRWTYDHTVEAPAGVRDMGGWTQSYYTPAQQHRLGVDAMGNPMEEEEEMYGLGSIGPRWTWDHTFERPAGERDMEATRLLTTPQSNS